MLATVIYKGPFTNYVDKILAFWPPTPLRSFSTFLPTKSQHFWTTYLPSLVNVVCEHPLSVWSCSAFSKIELPKWEVSHGWHYYMMLLEGNFSKVLHFKDSCLPHFLFSGACQVISNFIKSIPVGLELKSYGLSW